LPDGDGWQYEIKLDGYRVLRSRPAGRSGSGPATLTKRYPGVDEIVIDGEIVALDVSGKPVFTMLQNGVAYDWRQAYRT